MAFLFKKSGYFILIFFPLLRILQQIHKETFTALFLEINGPHIIHIHLHPADLSKKNRN